MKYKGKYWKENRGYGHAASIGCAATNDAEKLNEILWKLTHTYHLADQNSDMTIYAMEEAKGPLAGLRRDLRRILQEAESLLQKQSKENIQKAEAEWKAQSPHSA
jgi:hypothetical protein